MRLFCLGVFLAILVRASGEGVPPLGDVFFPGISPRGNFESARALCVQHKGSVLFFRTEEEVEYFNSTMSDDIASQPIWTSLVVMSPPIGAVWQGLKSGQAWRPVVPNVKPGTRLVLQNGEFRADTHASAVVVCRSVSNPAEAEFTPAREDRRDWSNEAIGLNADEVDRDATVLAVRDPVSQSKIKHVLESLKSTYIMNEDLGVKTRSFYTLGADDLKPLNYKLVMMASSRKHNDEDEQGGWTIDAASRSPPESSYPIHGADEKTDSQLGDFNNLLYNFAYAIFNTLKPAVDVKGGDMAFMVQTRKKTKGCKHNGCDKNTRFTVFDVANVKLTINCCDSPKYQLSFKNQVVIQYEQGAQSLIFVILVEEDVQRKAVTLKLYARDVNSDPANGPFMQEATVAEATPRDIKIENVMLGAANHPNDFDDGKHWRLWFRRFGIWTRTLSEEESRHLLYSVAGDEAETFSQSTDIQKGTTHYLSNMLRYGAEGGVPNHVFKAGDALDKVLDRDVDYTDLTFVKAANATGMIFKYSSSNPSGSFELEHRVVPHRVVVFANAACTGTVYLWFRDEYRVRYPSFTGAGVNTGVDLETATAQVADTVTVTLSASCTEEVQVFVQGFRKGAAVYNSEVGALGKFTSGSNNNVIPKGDGFAACSSGCSWGLYGSSTPTYLTNSNNFSTFLPTGGPSGFTMCLEVNPSSSTWSDPGATVIIISFNSTDSLAITMPVSSSIETKYKLQYRGTEVVTTLSSRSSTHTLCAVVDVMVLTLYVKIKNSDMALSSEKHALAGSSFRPPVPSSATKVSVGGLGFYGTITDLTVFSWAFKAVHVEEYIQERRNFDNRVSQGSVYSPVLGEQRTTTEWSRNDNVTTERSWCKTGVTPGPAAVWCNAWGTSTGVWEVPPESSSYFHIALESKVGQDVHFTVQGNPEVIVTTRVEGYGAHHVATFVALSDQCAHYSGAGADRKVDSSACKEKTRGSDGNVKLMQGWNSLIIRVNNDGTTPDGVVLQVRADNNLKWAYVAPPHFVATEPGVLPIGTVDVSGECGKDGTTEGKIDYDADGVGVPQATVKFKDHSCAKAFLKIGDEPSDTFEVYEEPKLILMTSSIEPDQDGTITMQTMRQLTLSFTAYGDKDVPTGSYTDDITLINTTDYPWKDLLIDAWVGTNTVLGKAHTAVDGRANFSVYFAASGTVNISFDSSIVGLPVEPSYLVVEVSLHDCPGDCLEPNGCDTLFGCICSQTSDNNFDRLKNCQECIAGYAGPACDINCPSFPEQPVCGGHGTCEDGVAGSGLCTCDGNWALPSCTNCEPSYWGVSCLAKCECDDCNDGVAGTGECECKKANSDGYDPKDCSKCVRGYVEKTTANGQECQKCPAGCSGRGDCKNSDDSSAIFCDCDANFGGVDCSECVPSQTGSDCDKSCPDTIYPAKFNAAPGSPYALPCNGQGSCYFSDTTEKAECECDEGYNGTSCAVPCPRFADDVKPCSGHGACMFNASDGTTYCGCDDPYEGDLCETSTPATTCVNCNTTQGICVEENGEQVCKCLEGYYDDACDSQCGCQNGGRCSNNGTCYWNCTSPFAAGNNDQCKLACPTPDGFLCGGRGTCDIATATCNCIEGWAGEDCRQCAPDFVGSLCSIRCIDANRDTANTKECVCKADYLPPDCEKKKCDPQNYGEDCSESCEQVCTNKQECDAGQCVCRADDHTTGIDCSLCIDGYYRILGTECRQCCNGHGVCNDAGEQCECFADDDNGYFAGDTCDVCQEGFDLGDATCKTRGLKVTMLRKTPLSAIYENARMHMIYPRTGEVLVGDACRLANATTLHESLEWPDELPGRVELKNMYIYNSSNNVERVFLLFVEGGRDLSIFICDWDANEMEIQGGCNQPYILSLNESYVSSVGYKDFIYVAYSSRVVAYQGQGQATPCVDDVLSPSDFLIKAIGIVGDTLVIGGAREDYWDITTVAGVSKGCAGKAPQAPIYLRDYFFKSNMPLPLRNQFCSSDPTVFDLSGKCEAKSMRVVTAIEAVDDNTYVAAFEGKYKEAKLVKITLDDSEYPVLTTLGTSAEPAEQVNSIAVDSEGDQVFVNHRSLLHRVQLSNMTLRGRKATNYDQIMIQKSERLLWGSWEKTSFFFPMLLAAVERVEPPLIHRNGVANQTTTVTVHGLGFVSTDTCKFDFERESSVETEATVSSSHNLTCVAPKKYFCLVTVGFEDQYTDDATVAVDTTRVPTILAIEPALQPNETDTNVLIALSGTGMLSTPYTTCQFMTDIDDYTIAHRVKAFLVQGTNKTYCRTPEEEVLWWGVSLSLDGQQFSNYSEFIGKAAKLRACFTGGVMGNEYCKAETIASEDESILTNVTVALYSGSNQSLGVSAEKMYDLEVSASYQDSNGTMLPATLHSSALPQAGCGKRIISVGGGTQGIGEFCGLHLANPIARDYYITVTHNPRDGEVGQLQPTEWTITVTPGAPYNITLASLSGDLAFSDKGIAPEMTVLVLDKAGNMITERPTNESDGQYQLLTTCFFMYESSGVWVTEAKAETSLLILDEIAFFDTDGTKVTVSPEIWPSSTAEGENSVEVTAAASFRLGSFSFVPQHHATEAATLVTLWTLQGSSDGSSWTVLSQPETESEQDTHIPVDSTESYQHYRVTIRKAINETTRGVPSAQYGRVPFKQMTPIHVQHRRTYKIVFRTTPTLTYAHTRSPNFTTTPCIDLEEYEVPGTGDCGICPKESAWCYGDTVYAKNGSWRPNELTMNFTACPLSLMCTRDDMGAPCHDSSRGTVCGDCAEGYVANHFDKSCNKCADASGVVMFFVVLLLFAAVVAYSVAHVAGWRPEVMIWMRMFIDQMQTLAACGYMTLPFPSDLQNFFQGINWVTFNTDEFEEMRCSFGMGILEYYGLSLALPLFALPGFALVYIIHRALVKRKEGTAKGKMDLDINENRFGAAEGEEGDRWVDLVEEVGESKDGNYASPLQLFAIVLLCIVYFTSMSTVRRSSSVLDCTEYEEIPACHGETQEARLPLNCTTEGVYKSFVKRHAGVECEGSPYSAYKGVAITIIVLYMLVVPLALFVSSRVYHTAFGDNALNMAFGVLSKGYKPGKGAWGVVVMVRKGALAMVTTFTTDNRLQGCLVLWVLAASLLIQLGRRPHKKEIHNSAESAGLLLLVLLVCASLLLELGTSSDSSESSASSPVEGVLDVALFVLVVAMFATLFYALYRIVRKKKMSKPVVSESDMAEMQDLAVFDTPEACWMRLKKGRDVRMSGGGDFVNVGSRVVHFSEILGIDVNGNTLTLFMASTELVLTGTTEDVLSYGDWLKLGICPEDEPEDSPTARLLSQSDKTAFSQPLFEEMDMEPLPYSPPSKGSLTSSQREDALLR